MIDIHPRGGTSRDVLRYIAQGTASLTGEDFFRGLTRCLAAALNVRWAFVSEFRNSDTRVCMIAYWNGSRFDAPFEYDLVHTPCESVLRGEVGFYPQGVQQCFPLHRELADEGIESYLAIPMLDPSGRVIGHVGAMDDKPMHGSDDELDIFRIFGARAGAELERLRAERLRCEAEQRLSSILANATDAIVAIDGERRIQIFNRSAEEIFLCHAHAAIGARFDEFVAPQHRTLLARALADASQPQAWLPEGISGLRSNGEDFPLELTWAQSESGGLPLTTLIMRDLNERTKADALLSELRSQNCQLQEVVRRQQEFGGLVGGSPQMQALFRDIEQVAATDSTVLIMGETGTGKEGIARGVHDASPRRERPLVTVNCAALPSELIESELFGHEKGAFTGATSLRRGRFELADGGTIFLDEAGELSAQAQAKLLRVLQEQSFERVGGGAPIRVDVRVIAATNRDLGEMVKSGAFRADLYYRLNVFPLLVPPLRERRSDIPALAQHFVEKFARKLGKPLQSVAPLSLERLRRYHWPGNVRELQNVIERAAILASGSVIEIPESLILPVPGAVPEVSPDALEDVARSHIQRVLDECDWIIEGERGAAAVLGLKPSTLRYRMKLLDIQKPRRRLGAPA